MHIFIKCFTCKKTFHDFIKYPRFRKALVIFMLFVSMLSTFFPAKLLLVQYNILLFFIAMFSNKTKKL